MIAKKLRQLYTSFALATEYRGLNGSTYTPTTPVICYGPSTAGKLPWWEKRNMRQNLANKYGITEIEE